MRFDLSLSENPFPPLPSVLDAVQRTLSRANRYPEFLPHRLPRLIAEHLGVRTDQVVVGSGATGVALQIMQTLTRRGDEMVFATPTFDGYPILADMAGLKSVAVPLDSRGRQDLVALGRWGGGPPPRGNRGGARHTTPPAGGGGGASLMAGAPRVRGESTYFSSA
ncbi:aminotransferase class I/II-fold pyridoxal phosphate-dependent enzyme, partial [Nocardia wallacei]|uniref:aminotransferase class I/II-fold pyridoxal phosphate-dependent enzyme n=1 Tax=Nocardia wallacei TaxID=480035 RepID=UPI002458033D